MHRWDGDLHWDEITVPRPGAGEARISVEACGIGGTVVRYVHGSLSHDHALLPRVPGHELVGIVDAVGNVETDAHLVGRRVMAYFYLICDECGPCRTDAEPRCERLSGRVGVHRDGGYASSVVLPISNLLPVPDGVDPVAATVIPDAVATPVHVLRRTGTTASDRVVVIGAGGGVGIHMVQVAVHAGAAVVGIDVGSEKTAAIARYGESRDASRGWERLKAPSLFNGELPTVVIDLVGKPETLDWGFSALASGGRMAILASSDDVSFTLGPRRLVLQELSLLGSLYASRREVMEAADLIARRFVQPVIGEVVGPERVPAVHAQITHGDLIGRAAVVWARGAR